MKIFLFARNWCAARRLDFDENLEERGKTFDDKVWRKKQAALTLAKVPRWLGKTRKNSSSLFEKYFYLPVKNHERMKFLYSPPAFARSAKVFRHHALAKGLKFSIGSTELRATAHLARQTSSNVFFVRVTFTRVIYFGGKEVPTERVEDKLYMCIYLTIESRKFLCPFIDQYICIEIRTVESS